MLRRKNVPSPKTMYEHHFRKSARSVQRSFRAQTCVMARKGQPPLTRQKWNAALHNSRLTGSRTQSRQLGAVGSDRLDRARRAHLVRGRRVTASWLEHTGPSRSPAELCLAARPGDGRGAGRRRSLVRYPVPDAGTRGTGREAVQIGRSAGGLHHEPTPLISPDPGGRASRSIKPGPSSRDRRSWFIDRARPAIVTIAGAIEKWGVEHG
jgi:hypothetical protein